MKSIRPTSRSRISMRHPKAVLFLLALATAAGLQNAVAADSSPASVSAVPVVAVSILPQSEFVARIGGGKVKVLTLVGPGASPHSYEPTPRQMAELSGASIWLSIGVEFENALLPKVKSLYPKLKVVNTVKDVVYRKLESHAHEEGAAADEAGGLDPHVWLGREAVITQLAATRDALIALKPSEAAIFNANHDAYLREINSVFSLLAKELAPLKGGTTFVYHPSFGYFLDNFGIKQEAVEVGGKEPTQKTLSLLIKNAREDGARIIFVQKQFSPTAAKTVAKAIGGIVVEIDPLAPNWLENIKSMGDALKKTVAR
ncbi:MAG: zinc ABC transporter substrate-binding protein [Rectinemataceae bacterium]|nr:zinc ABC transporter substrate-binding protein [Rectinemataceae bacterium]